MKMVALTRVYDKARRIEYSPGDVFEAASERDARHLAMIGKARFDGPAANATDLPPREPPAEPATPAPAPPAEDIMALRGDYESLVGKRPFMGWDADEIRSRMSTYRRRDMRAED